MDVLAALRLQMEWGADEALLDAPVDWFAASAGAMPRAVPPLPVAGPPGVSRLAGDGGAPRVADRIGPALPGGAAEAAAVAAGAADLVALHAALDGFDACPLRATAGRTVAPSGKADSGLVLIAEAPGADDDRTGEAFSGAAGARLDMVLGSVGLTRSDLLLALLVPWRPPGGRPPTESEMALCLPFLLRLLALTRPRRIVLAGAAPLRLLTGEEGGLRRLRGRWTPVRLAGRAEPVPALPMLPAEQWLSNAARKRTTWGDLLMLRAALDSDRAGAAQTGRPQTGEI